MTVTVVASACLGSALCSSRLYLPSTPLSAVLVQAWNSTPPTQNLAHCHAIAGWRTRDTEAKVQCVTEAAAVNSPPYRVGAVT